MDNILRIVFGLGGLSWAAWSASRTVRRRKAERAADRDAEAVIVESDEAGTGPQRKASFVQAWTILVATAGAVALTTLL